MRATNALLVLVSWLRAASTESGHDGDVTPSIQKWLTMSDHQNYLSRALSSDDHQQELFYTEL